MNKCDKNTSKRDLQIWNISWNTATGHCEATRFIISNKHIETFLLRVFFLTYSSFFRFFIFLLPHLRQNFISAVTYFLHANENIYPIAPKLDGNFTTINICEREHCFYTLSNSCVFFRLDNKWTFGRLSCVKH